jgi:alkanesulfonate monooxygenase SsuD/methylene tetrahydromethanopterin reductase-like flavin-dependent oxidoreductase (luciferase family)
MSGRRTVVEERALEFSIFVQMYIPGAKAHDPAVEHQSVLNELELVRQADRHGWKYVWVTEHHALAEYSHLSANEVFIPTALAQTERIHVGSGIFNLNPIVNHPVRMAERVAMLDHVSEGRFEFGTGRGAGSWEVGTFNLDTSKTKEPWEEVIRELPKMWDQQEYSFDGKYFQVPPRNILPKPWGGPGTHPAMWVAAGNPATYEKAAHAGLGVLGFNITRIHDMKDHVDTYKDNIGSANPVGHFVNDNVMISNGLVCLEDGKEARRVATDMSLSYLQSLMLLYHDTFPISEEMKQYKWPAYFAEPTLEDIEERIEQGFILCGTPDEVLEQVSRYEAVGCDQVCFGMPIGMSHEHAMETIALFGEQVIPKLDKDPVHRTTRMREEAAAARTASATS